MNYSQKLIKRVIKMDNNNYKIIRESFFKIFGTQGIFINYQKIDCSKVNNSKTSHVKLIDHPDFNKVEIEKHFKEIEECYKNFSVY